MRKILIFNDGMAQGGTEKLLINLLNHLALDSFDVTLLLPFPSADNVLLQEVSDAVEIKYIHNENYIGWEKWMNVNHMLFFPKSFAKTMNLDFRIYDMLICFKEGFYARLFSEVPVPKILWIHNMLYKPIYEIHSFKERLAVWLNKKQLKVTRDSYAFYNKIICVSNACKDAYLRILYSGIHPPQEIDVLFNAIDLTSVVEKSKESIVDLPQGITKFVLLTRNSAEKRTDRLINASKRLKDERYSFHVYIIGDVDVDITGLDENITLLGCLDNPFPYVLQSNWLVCVSERESFSLALLEAMALKTPVITTNCGGPSDIVDGGKYGILVENSSQGVYEGMKKVLDDSTLSVQYSANLDKALSRFDYQGWLRQISEILKG